MLYNCSKFEKPDLWLKPTEIWEISADSFSLSKSHKCGHYNISTKHEGYSGLSLRFPRFKRVRHDKKIRFRIQDYMDLDYQTDFGTEVGTTTTEILELYERNFKL